VKFGLYGLHKGENAEPAAFARRARLAEDTGFESLWVGDHIALPADAPDDPHQPRLEAVVAIAHLAAVTERVRLGFGVIVLPQRQPVLLAKQLSTIDVLSGGRLIVGLGAGYLEAELNALGATLAERGARVDEHLAAMRALWDEPAPDFDGRFVRFGGLLQRPRPVQRPHPPVVLGGHAPAALRRAARTADGWFGWELSPEAVAQHVGELREGMEITVKPDRELDAESVRRYAAAGVHRLVVEPAPSTGAATEALIAATGGLRAQLAE
jgi:probable F420-dependent oxidoreductase